MTLILLIFICLGIGSYANLYHKFISSLNITSSSTFSNLERGLKGESLRSFLFFEVITDLEIKTDKSGEVSNFEVISQKLEFWRSRENYPIICENNCEWFPVNKGDYLLSPVYTPDSNIPVAEINGYLINQEVAVDLIKMMEDMNSLGLDPKVNSSYRNYRQQEQTFNFWVEQNLAEGLTFTEAETEANKVSAKPGESEHQLGTTVDISCNDCGSGFQKLKENEEIWIFLEKNAHKYGFVISYPEGKEDVTGYNHEPWHLRYVGIETATKFYNLGYLNIENTLTPQLLLEIRMFENLIG